MKLLLYRSLYDSNKSCQPNDFLITGTCMEVHKSVDCTIKCILNAVILGKMKLFHIGSILFLQSNRGGHTFVFDLTWYALSFCV